MTSIDTWNAIEFHTPCTGMRIGGSETKFPPPRLNPEEGQRKLWARPVSQDNSSPLRNTATFHTHTPPRTP